MLSSLSWLLSPSLSSGPHCPHPIIVVLFLIHVTVLFPVVAVAVIICYSPVSLSLSCWQPFIWPVVPNFVVLIVMLLFPPPCPLPLPALIAVCFLVRPLTVVVEGCCLWCGGVVVVNWLFYCGPPFLQVVAHGGSCCHCGGGIIGMNLFLGCCIVVMQLDPLY